MIFDWQIEDYERCLPDPETPAIERELALRELPVAADPAASTTHDRTARLRSNVPVKRLPSPACPIRRRVRATCPGTTTGAANRTPRSMRSLPAFGGSYRSDDLCATAACEPRPPAHQGNRHPCCGDPARRAAATIRGSERTKWRCRVVVSAKFVVRGGVRRSMTCPGSTSRPGTYPIAADRGPWIDDGVVLAVGGVAVDDAVKCTLG